MEDRLMGKKDLIPPKSLFKYRTFADPHNSVRMALASNFWWFGSRRSFDDGEDLVFPGIKDHKKLAGLNLEKAKADAQDILDKTGVLCLSESATDVDLWHRYASDGAGVCIELESDYVTVPDVGPFKVTYSDKPKPLWDHFAGPKKRRKQTDAHLLQKKRIWRRQREWRCIRKWKPREKPTANRYYSVEPRALLSVIFGWQLTEEEKLQIIKWINSGGWTRKITLRQAVLENGRVKILKYVPKATNTVRGNDALNRPRPL